MFSKGEFNLTMFVSSQSTVQIDVVDQPDTKELNYCIFCFMQKNSDAFKQQRLSKLDTAGNQYNIRKLLSLIAY